MPKTTTTDPADTKPDAPAAAAPLTVPVYAAGPGLPEAAFAPARAAGFTEATDELGNIAFTSPDGRLAIEWGPESYRYRTNPTGGLWQIKYTDATAPAEGWSAQLGDNVPAEAVGALITALTAPGGLNPDRA